MAFCSSCGNKVSPDFIFCDKCGVKIKKDVSDQEITATETTKLACPYCSKQVKSVAKFCPECGKPLTQIRKCTKCGNFLAHTSLFCGHCGEPVPKSCPKCGHVFQKEEKFCPKCGCSANATKPGSFKNPFDENPQPQNTFSTTETTSSSIPLCRVQEGKILAGVCSGLQAKFNLNAWIFRLLFIFTGIGLPIYIVLAIVLKYDDPQTNEAPSETNEEKQGPLEKIKTFVLSLYRLRNGKILAGVCTGIADKYKINAWLVRVIAVFSGIGLIPYIVLAIVLKYDDPQTNEAPSETNEEKQDPLEKIKTFVLSLYRLRNGKILAGVCTGIADKYKINAWLVRVIAVFSGIGLIPYIVLAIILKYNDNEIIEQKDFSESAQSTTSHEINKKKIAIIAGAIALAGIVITLIFVLCGKSGDVFVDTRDGQKYKTITFGPWTFMTENIRYNNSYNVCKTDDPTCEKHGRYYFQDGAALACPPGWKMLDDKYAMEKVLVAKLAQKYNMSAFEVISDMGKIRKVYTKDNEKAAILEFIDSEACIFDGKTNDFTCGEEYCNSEGMCQKEYVGCLNSGRKLQCYQEGADGDGKSIGSKAAPIRCYKEMDEDEWLALPEVQKKIKEEAAKKEAEERALQETAEKAGPVKYEKSADNSLTDSRDGKKYKTVKIGNQVWMAENLNFKSGDSWCYNNSEQNCNEYGRLYSWGAAQKVCPSGWRIASDSEWDAVAGNSASFGIKAAGFRNAKGKFELLGKRADFWTADNAGDKGKYHYYSASAGTMDKNTYSKKGGMSVRCVQASACDDIDWDLFQGDSPSAEAYRAGLEEIGCVWQENEKIYHDNGASEDESDQLLSAQMLEKLSTVELSYEDLKGFSKDELRLLRNAIFAKHGYIFKNDDLKNYFGQFTWYAPKYSDINDQLTPVEKKNVDALRILEVEIAKFTKDIDQVLKDVENLQKNGKTVLGGRRDKTDEDIGDGLAGLLGGGGGGIATKAKGSIKIPSERDIDIGAGGGSRSAADIIKVVRQRTPGLRHIYNKFLKKKPGFQGKVTLKFTIASGGEVISISIASSTTGYGEFDGEIKTAVSRWTFSKVKSGNTTVTIPFTFSE